MSQHPESPRLFSDDGDDIRAGGRNRSENEKSAPLVGARGSEPRRSRRYGLPGASLVSWRGLPSARGRR
jgi:hypothetical protein